MARTIGQINKQITDAVQADTTNFPADFRNNPSQVARWRLWTYIQAVAIALFEQLLDLFKTDIESQMPAIATCSFEWLKAQVLAFQYSATTPQIPVLINYIPQYAVVDTTLQIIDRCSIERNADKSLTVKVAKANGVPLTAPEQTALAAYIDLIFGAGSEIFIVSAAADKLFIEADIYYNGLYTVTILNSVKASLEAYLASLPFNGQIKVSDIEMAIKNTVGVNDVNIKYVCTRKDSDTFVLHGNNVIYNISGGINILTYKSYAGHIVEETTSGSTWTNKLTFITS